MHSMLAGQNYAVPATGNIYARYKSEADFVVNDRLPALENNEVPNGMNCHLDQNSKPFLIPLAGNTCQLDSSYVTLAENTLAPLPFVVEVKNRIELYTTGGTSG